jgi:hypothetical protein
MGAGTLPLGPVPHMIRGHLGGGFAQHSMVGQAFRQCIACSGTVVDQYHSHGWHFILSALQVCQQIASYPCCAAFNTITDICFCACACRTPMRWRT